MSPAIELALYLAANGALALAALAKGALTPRGAAISVVVGTGIAWGGGFRSWVLLGVFFFSSTIWSAWRRDEKRAAERLTGKTGRRDAAQVLANGLPALACALGWRLAGEPAFLVALAASLAEANADTWASEAGLLSRHEPRSILGFRPVPRGHSGGVTLLGIVASAGGSLAVALAYAAGHLLPSGTSHLSRPLSGAALVAGAGFAGALLDSVLGSGLQARYRDAAGAHTERPRSADGAPNHRVRGIPGFSNDVVNLSSGAAAAAGALLYALAAW